MTSDSDLALFEMSYGSFRPRYQWMLLILCGVGLIGIPVGIFRNEGWEMGNRPIEPWAAAGMSEAFALATMLAGTSAWYASKLHRKLPLRVVVTVHELIGPKGLLSKPAPSLPLAEIEVSVLHLGIVSQLQIKHGRRRVLLTSAMSPSNEHFEQLCGHVA